VQKHNASLNGWMDVPSSWIPICPISFVVTTFPNKLPSHKALVSGTTYWRSQSVKLACNFGRRHIKNYPYDRNQCLESSEDQWQKAGLDLCFFWASGEVVVVEVGLFSAYSWNVAWE
jgi:hypothetical protein